MLLWCDICFCYRKAANQNGPPLLALIRDTHAIRSELEMAEGNAYHSIYINLSFVIIIPSFPHPLSLLFLLSTASLALDWLRPLRPPVSRASAGVPVSSSPCIASLHALCFGSVRSTYLKSPPSPVLSTSPTSVSVVCVQPPVLPCFHVSAAAYVHRSTPSPFSSSSPASCRPGPVSSSVGLASLVYSSSSSCP